MSIEEIIRELLVTMQGDKALLDALTSGEDMRRLSSGMVIGPANRLVELIAGRFSIPNGATIDHASVNVHYSLGEVDTSPGYDEAAEEARVARELEDHD